MPIRVNLDRVLLQRRMSLTELADRVGVTIANLSILTTRATTISNSLRNAVAPARADWIKAPFGG